MSIEGQYHKLSDGIYRLKDERLRAIERADNPPTEDQDNKIHHYNRLILNAHVELAELGSRMGEQPPKAPNWTEQGDIQAAAYADMADLQPDDPDAKAVADYYAQQADFRHAQSERS